MANRNDDADDEVHERRTPLAPPPSDDSLELEIEVDDDATRTGNLQELQALLTEARELDVVPQQDAVSEGDRDKSATSEEQDPPETGRAQQDKPTPAPPRGSDPPDEEPNTRQRALDMQSLVALERLEAFQRHAPEDESGSADGPDGSEAEDDEEEDHVMTMVRTDLSVPAGLPDASTEPEDEPSEEHAAFDGAAATTGAPSSEAGSEASPLTGPADTEPTADANVRSDKPPTVDPAPVGTLPPRLAARRPRPRPGRWWIVLGVVSLVVALWWFWEQGILGS